MRRSNSNLFKSKQKTQKPGDLNTDVSFGVFVEVFFHLAWRQIFQCSMRPFGIIKLNIGSDAGLKRSIGSNISSVELLFFQ